MPHTIKAKDSRGQQYDYQPSGSLYVRQDPDQPFIPAYKKKGDVGLDIPVKILIDQTRFGNGFPDPDKLRHAMLYPSLKHFIYPNGLPDDPHPCLEIPALGWAEIPSGISIKLPDDAWGYLKSRSSTTWKKHLIIIGSTIDPGYTGQLGTLVYNPNFQPVRIHEFDPKTGRGDCLAQLILIPVYPVKEIVLVSELPDTERGKTGFGSTSHGG